MEQSNTPNPAEGIIQDLHNQLNGLLYLKSRIADVNAQIFGAIPEDNQDQSPEDNQDQSKVSLNGFYSEITHLIAVMDETLKECHARFDRIANFF